MNAKLKRVLSIIALVSMCIFIVLLPLWLIFPKMFGNFTAAITFFFFGIAFLIALTIYFFKGFPSQQLKAEQRRKIEEEYRAFLEKEEQQESDNQENNTEQEGDNQENEEQQENNIKQEINEENKE